MMTGTVRSVKLPKLTDLAALEEAAECLKTLAHPHRLRMVQMLLRGRYTVGELAGACGISSPRAAAHAAAGRQDHGVPHPPGRTRRLGRPPSVGAAPLRRQDLTEWCLR